MEAYLSATGAVDNELEVVSVEDEVGIYRGPDHKIFLETNESEHELGFRDVSISSRRSSGPPIVIGSDNCGVYVHNVDNRNAITINSLRDSYELFSGDKKSLKQDCLLELGYSTEVLLTLEDKQDNSEGVKTYASDGVHTEITVTAYVSLLCDHLRRSAHESASETQGHLQELFDTVREHPAEISGFDEAKATLEKELKELKKTDGLVAGAEITYEGKFSSDERVKRYENLANRFEKLYKRI